MIQLLTRSVCERLTQEDAVLVHVERTEGSAPRDAGTWMAVFAHDLLGTIGGGQLELQATEEARRRLAGAAPDDARPRRYPLGPSLGQCCGGVVYLRFERVGTAACTGSECSQCTWGGTSAGKISSRLSIQVRA